MRRPAIMVLCLATLLMLPSGHAQFHKTLPYEATTGFMEDFDGIPNLVSGAVEYTGEEARNSTLLLGTSGFEVDGLDRVCWEDPESGANECRKAEDLNVQLLDGGSVAFRTPNAYAPSLVAEHVLAFFADASKVFGENRPENIALGQSLVAFPTQDTVHMGDVDEVPLTSASAYSSFNDAIDDLALLITLSDDSTLVVRQGGETLATLTGDGQWVGFQGLPAFTSTSAEVAVLPMPDGSSAAFTRSDARAARDGLSPESLQAALGSLQESEGQSDANDLDVVTEVSDALSGFLNGAYLGIDTSSFGAETDALTIMASTTLVRFESLHATRDGDQVQHEGSAALQIQGGEVAGAQDLVGGIIPFVGIILWGFAIALFVMRLVLKPDKTHPRWDKLHWIGWIAAPVASIIAFILWDRIMVGLWGTSILTSNASGAALGAISALQLLPLIFAGLFFGMPTRSIAKSGTRFLGQGRFMNIGGVIAPFVVVVLGAPLILSLLAAILDQAPNLGG